MHLSPGWTAIKEFPITQSLKLAEITFTYLILCEQSRTEIKTKVGWSNKVFGLHFLRGGFLVTIFLLFS